MYKYGGLDHLERPNDGLPETSSIQKQITYGDEVARLTDNYVRNAFILPYNKELERFKFNNDAINIDCDRNLAYIGFATSSWRLEKKDHDYIFSFLIDFNYLLRNYNRSNNRITLKLYDEIERQIRSTNEK